MRILAVDFGGKRIGLAISDPSGRLASPHKTLRNEGTARATAAVLAEAQALSAVRILVGVPVLADGSLGNGARRVLDFAHALAQQTALPVTWLNESFTTAEAYDRLKSQGGKRRTPQQEREIIDQLAAALLLEEYLAELPTIPRPLPELPPEPPPLP